VHKHYGVVRHDPEQFLVEYFPGRSKRGERGKEPRLNLQEEEGAAGEFGGNNSLHFSLPYAGDSKYQCAEYGWRACPAKLCPACSGRDSRIAGCQFDTRRRGRAFARRVRAMATAIRFAQLCGSRRPARSCQAS
jgi:hypothetical protein